MERGNIKDRLMKYISFRHLTISGFERRCGLANGYLNAMRSGMGAKKLENVLREFPELNREWLVNGEGEMLRSTPITQNMTTINQSGGTNTQNANHSNDVEALWKQIEEKDRQIATLLAIIDKFSK